MFGIKSAVILAASLLVGSAFASPVGPGDLSPLFLDGVLDIAVGNTLPGISSAYSFSDVFSFTLDQDSDAQGILNSTVKGGRGITAIKVSLFGGTLEHPVVDLNAGNGFEFDGLGAGSYTLTVSGNVLPKGGSYGGALLITPVGDVPEPESMALLLAGLGVAGFVASRRRTAAR
jgi:hypothetical protein